MQKQFYYRDLSIPQGDQNDENIPMLINCTGVTPTNRAFYSNNAIGRQDYYLQYVATGKMPCQFSNQTIDFHEDMFVVYRPHTPYCFWHEADNALCYYWIHFTGFYASALLDNLGIKTNQYHRIFPNQHQRDRIGNHFQRLFQEFIHRRPGFESACAAITTDILVALARGTDRLQSGDIRKLVTVQYLHSYFQENTPISQLAAMEHLSECRYRQVFRNHTGYSPGQYRTILRLQHACDLLTQTDQSVAQIAVNCGYDDVLYFHRLFKKHEGITPIQYRSRNRNAATMQTDIE